MTVLWTRASTHPEKVADSVIWRWTERGIDVQELAYMADKEE